MDIFHGCFNHDTGFLFFQSELLDENTCLTDPKGLQEWMCVERHNFSLKLSKVREERRSLKPHLATKINNLISEVAAVQGLSSDASCE